jgi:hypothetical protein
MFSCSRSPTRSQNSTCMRIVRTTWYDHVMGPIVSPSAAPADALNGAGKCGNVKDPSAYPDRCGYGPRLPLLVVPSYASRTSWITR